MKIHNIIRTIGVALFAGTTFVSCDVELLPLNTVILENYWTNKDDVQSVVTSCYAGLCSSDVITRMVIWGEVRSDNCEPGQQIANAGNDLKYLLSGNILETNSYCEWSSFYNVINRCNTVEMYAPIVQERDPNFTESDLRQTMAEIKAIRALCYFYLIRTFGDVPFTFTPSIDDGQEFVIPATKQELILDTLIMDVESYMMYAPKRYVVDNETSGKISRNGVYALLADLYLWRASNAKVDPAKRNEDYLKCIEYCDKVIAAKIDEYKEDRYGNLKRQISRDIYGENGYPLIEEWSEADQNSGTGVNAKAYALIFGTGHSFESLFELSFSSNSASGGTTNSTLSTLYGSNSSAENGAQLAATEALMSSKPNNQYQYDNSLLFTSYDFRSQENFQWHETNAFNIRKYVTDQARVVCGSPQQWAVQQPSYRTENYANWIIYRLTDIMLLKAEAEVQVADYIDNYVPDTSSVKTRVEQVYGNVYTTSKEYYDDAFNIVDAIYKRSAPNAPAQYKPVRNSVTNKRDFDNLVEAERRRELMFEGKRYYDLLRKARRDGSTTNVVGQLSSKYQSNSSAMRIKMTMLEFLYMPYAKEELRRNKLLKQNPAFDKEKKNNRTGFSD